MNKEKTQEELVERIADDAALAELNREKQEELANEVVVAIRDENEKLVTLRNGETLVIGPMDIPT